MKPAAVIVALCVLTGCTTIKYLEPIGGSRAGGTVKMAYEYGGSERPVPQWEAADQKAKERCGAWGYQAARRFEGLIQRCIDRGTFGCHRWNVVVTYQCEKPTAPPPAVTTSPPEAD